MDDETVKALQAAAEAQLQRDMAAADRARDPLRVQRKLFLMALMKIRYQKKLSQAELADRAGMPQSTIARIESGKANPSLNTLLKIAKSLDVNLVVE